MPHVDPAHWLLIAFAGLVIGVFSVVAGGGMFFSMPFMQWLFPEVAFGVLVGNVKVGSLFRSFGSTFSTHPQIEYRRNLALSALLVPGTVVGSTFIAHLSQKWMFPAVVLAVFLTLAAPKIAHLITQKTFGLAAFVTGLYIGVFGAGSGLLLLALLRLKHKEDTEVAFVKIQARFVEMLTVVIAVATHALHGNIVAAIWIPWSAGALFGGYAGGRLLEKLGTLTGRAQMYILYLAFAISLAVAGVKFFE